MARKIALFMGSAQETQLPELIYPYIKHTVGLYLCRVIYII